MNYRGFKRTNNSERISDRRRQRVNHMGAVAESKADVDEVYEWDHVNFLEVGPCYCLYSRQ